MAHVFLSVCSLDCFCDKWFVVCRFQLNGFKSLHVCFKRPLLLEKRPASMTTCISCISMCSRLWFLSEFTDPNCAKQVIDRSWCSSFRFQESIPRSKYHEITSLRTTKLQSNYLAVKHAGQWTHVFTHPEAAKCPSVVLREHALPYSMCLEPRWTRQFPGSRWPCDLLASLAMTLIKNGSQCQICDWNLWKAMILGSYITIVSSATQ